MPTINKGKKINNYVRHGKAKEIWQNIYNTSEWRKLRQAYIISHPLCERCLERNIIAPATEVHHITPISTATNEMEMKDLGYNENNLMALCEKCHHEIHNKMKKP